ncbi:putative RNA polymerase II subunit B1 CTD phosphatase rpap2 isoform X1 [Labrus bergylta]|uniref:putative RNA polymerase II subunit B1 CTD phosphatase rpap2 isoform X1 n=1 Tax=Labrus bergylta TaxID=56723 RepID=UPI0033133158
MNCPSGLSVENQNTSRVKVKNVENRNSMETDHRLCGGAAKTTKKGGRSSKTLTEEEARRAEVLKESLRERVELDRRALKVVERLLEDRVTEDFLVDCARFIFPSNYQDAVEERSIAKLCGYPICPKKLDKIPTQQFKISTKSNKVYDITERKLFCSNFCYKASKEFELQISTTPLWLRHHESPSEIKLMKKGDCGSSGEEVLLSQRRLQEEDVEDPLAARPEDPHSSQQHRDAAGLNHSDHSDIEQEQDFVSSVVSKRQGPRVHWGDLPKRYDEGVKGEGGKMERQRKQRREGDEEETKDESKKQSLPRKTEFDPEDPKPQLSLNIDKPNEEKVTEEQGWHEEPNVKEATIQLDLCSLSETITPPAPPPDDSAAIKESTQTTESKHSPPSTLNSQSTVLTEQPGLNITQVGMSKRGAAGLQDLLKNHTAGARAESIRLNLLKCLRRTLQDWSTDDTLKFLYGADHSLGAPFADVKEKEEVQEDEELDEDDLEVTNEATGEVDARVQERPSAAAPDYEALRKETQQLELSVREFYKGTWILPEEGKESSSDKVSVEEQSRKDPALPLVDSQAQHLIQKRITVEKLNSCLRNIVGPLCLTMSDVSADLNNLVRTFRFTNTNIIHKTPEWTLLAVVLLHLLSEVSPVVLEALKKPESDDYLNTLIEEQGLHEQDLLNLVRMYKTSAH